VRLTLYLLLKEVELRLELADLLLLQLPFMLCHLLLLRQLLVPLLVVLVVLVVLVLVLVLRRL